MLTGWSEQVGRTSAAVNRGTRDGSLVIGRGSFVELAQNRAPGQPAAFNPFTRLLVLTNKHIRMRVFKMINRWGDVCMQCVEIL